VDSGQGTVNSGQGLGTTEQGLETREEPGGPTLAAHGWGAQFNSPLLTSVDYFSVSS
jgi:hypothetical protein